MEVNFKNPKIFVICGKARHGKDTIADIIKKIYLEENKNTINLHFASYIKEYAKRITTWDGSEESKPRSILQEIGTDVIRNKIDNKFFIKRIIEDIKVYSYYFDCITISDCRIELEVDSIRESYNNTVFIKVNRPNFDNGLTEEQKNHITETALDNYDKFDYIVENDGTISDLENKIRNLLMEVK